MSEELTGYDAKYSSGQGWRYNVARETVVVRDLILKPLALPVQSRVLEIGCGEGFHADVLRIQGMIVDAVDLSKPAILNARKAYPYRALTFRCDDVRSLHALYRDGAFRMVFSRAMSWFHWDLRSPVGPDGVDLQSEMERLMDLVEPGGFFCLQVCTDFSGDMRNGVCMNTAESYLDFYGQFGEVVLFTDWRGNLIDREAPAAPTGGVILAVRKPL